MRVTGCKPLPGYGQCLFLLGSLQAICEYKESPDVTKSNFIKCHDNFEFSLKCVFCLRPSLLTLKVYVLWASIVHFECSFLAKAKFNSSTTKLKSHTNTFPMGSWASIVVFRINNHVIGVGF